MRWYYVENQKPVGPLTLAEFDERVAGRTILPDTLVWNEGLTEWVTLRDLRGPSPAVSAPPAPAISAAPASPTAAPATSAPASAPLAQAAPAGPAVGWVAPVGGRLPYAGFWIRFFAIFLDGLILGAALGVLCGVLFLFFGMGGVGRLASRGSGAGALGCLFDLFVIAIGVCYEGYLVGKYGATLGKMALHLKVTDPQGGAISYGRSFGRYFAKLLSSMTLCIGYLIAAFDDEKRALHDRICDTRVVRR